MTTEPNETMLDGCLEEILGGTIPPDLTARILKAHSESTDSILDASLSEVLGDVTPPNVADRVIQRSEQRAPSVEVAASESKRAMSLAGWASIALTLALVVLGVTVVGRGLWKGPPTSTPIIAHEEGAFELAPSFPDPDEIVAVQTEGDPLSPTPIDPPPGPVQIPVPTIRHPLQLKRPAPGTTPTPVGIASVEAEPEALDDRQVVQSIDDLIQSGWQQAGASPSAKLDDGPWCNRVFEKVLGREPTQDELGAFVADRSPEKRLGLLESLMNEDDYVDDFARHWGQVWTDVLLASSHQRVNRDGLSQFLSRSFAEGDSIANISAALITATGSGTFDPKENRETHRFNGAVNYLTAYSDSAASRQGSHVIAAAHISRTFLGIAMECNQCHDAGAWRGYKQQSFWEFNAFFRQLRIEGNGVLTDVDFRGEGSTPEDAEIYYEMQDGKLLLAYPVFVDRATEGFDNVPTSGYLKVVNRREELAKLIVRSRFFRQAMVNRFWGELFGAGFTTPVDDLGPHNPASHPELLAKLGDQFAAHDYDVRKLITWIVLSEPFGLAPEKESSEREIGTQELFASFPVVVPPKKSLEETLQFVVQLHKDHSNFSGGFETTARVAPVDPSVPATEITQADMMPSISRYEVHEESDSLFGQIVLGSKLSTEQKVQHMFYAAVHRPPTKRELATVDKLLGESATDELPASPHAINDALRYIWWALSNSRDAR